MRRKQKIDDIYVDANGCLTERVRLGGQDVIVHYDDIPESDITTIDGIRVTTALRTMIDVAPDVTTAELEDMVQHCLSRGLFTPDEAIERVGRPDMHKRLGAKLVRHVVTNLGNVA